MKPNYYTLIVFVVVCGALVGAHFAHIDEAKQLLLAILGAASQSLLPQAVSKKDGDQ